MVEKISYRGMGLGKYRKCWGSQDVRADVRNSNACQRAELDSYCAECARYGARKCRIDSPWLVITETLSRREGTVSDEVFKFCHGLPVEACYGATGLFVEGLSDHVQVLFVVRLLFFPTLSKFHCFSPYLSFRLAFSHLVLSYYRSVVGMIRCSFSVEYVCLLPLPLRSFDNALHCKQLGQFLSPAL